MIVTGIRIWLTGEKILWDDQVPNNIGERCVTILAAAFEEFINEGVVDIGFDVIDSTEVEGEEV